MHMRFAILNLSKTVSDSDASTLVHLGAMQLVSDVAPDHGLSKPSVTLLPATQSALAQAVARRYAVVTLKDDLSDPNALGDHSVTTQGLPVGEIGVNVSIQNGGMWGNGGLLSVLSHELVEALLDPYIDTWDDMTPDGTTQMAHEGADPVQGNSYEIAPGFFVSNYVRPDYFNPYYAVSPVPPNTFDRLGVVARPFEIAPNGYAVLRKKTEHGWETAPVFGSKVSEDTKALIRTRRRVSQRMTPSAF